ncbi:hypothetical protein [Psychrobacillus sp. BL-248-WT-3]|uniref:YxiF family protein n=1 Tax=Psychrobacillus sp. BL-248-WT-3 TaxID=2725306 RepID=UPI001F0E4735|nr:hypothetical protein [Psychrobacillus sp. BL-248-WT-3]
MVRKKYIIEHRVDKFGRGPHFHGADDLKGSQWKKEDIISILDILQKILLVRKRMVDHGKVLNLSDERKTKMELLKRKSRRKNLLKEINFMNLSEEPFLNIEDNDLFCKNVFSLLNRKENKIQLQGESYKEHIQKSIQLLNDTIDNMEVIPKQGRLLFFRENEIEAVLVNVNEVFSHLNKMIELTKFSVGYGDFILVAEDFNFGLCIERTEYFYELNVWGLS